jgi:hypothetical protein
MTHCCLCGWYDKGHDKACPELAIPEDRKKALSDNQRGYKDGRFGLELSDRETPSYRLGWRRGVVALEEAENGHDPRVD